MKFWTIIKGRLVSKTRVYMLLSEPMSAVCVRRNRRRSDIKVDHIFN